MTTTIQSSRAAMRIRERLDEILAEADTLSQVEQDPEAGEVLFDEKVAAIIDDEFPAWHSRPTRPGLWLTIGNRPRSWAFVALRLDAEDLARGAPFETEAVYGPIPERTVRAASERQEGERA